MAAVFCEGSFLKTVTQTLSRWNHTATRFKSLGQTLAQQAYDTLGDTRITSPIDNEQSEALEALGKKALQQLKDAQVAFEASGLIRATLAKKNADVGVAQKLATIDALRAEQKALEKVTDISLVVMPSATPERANKALENHTDPKDVYYRTELKSGVALRVVPMDAFDGFEQRLLVVSGDIQTLSDEVNDLNNASLSIELPEAAAELLKL